MYELAAEGYTCRQIARYFEKMGITSDTGAPLRSSRIGGMLRSVVYKGDFIMQNSYVNEDRKQVINKGELPKVYIKDDHPRIVSDELWEKAQAMLDNRLHDMSIDQSFIELNKENYPHKDKLFCAKCGYKLVRRKSGGGKGKTIWYCGGARNYGQRFCSGVSVTDLEVRRWGEIKRNLYISREEDSLGKAYYKYETEDEWQRNHEKQQPPVIPALTIENYPFLGKVYCKNCGMQLTRCYVSGTTDHFRWRCLGSEKYGKEFCEGISIPDELLQKVGEPEGNIYLGKENINGEERYGYTSKPDQIKERPRRKRKET